MQATSEVYAKISVGEPWDFCTPAGEGVFDVKVEKIESTFILATVVSPFEWNGNFVRHVIGMCRHVGEKTSDVKRWGGFISTLPPWIVTSKPFNNLA